MVFTLDQFVKEQFGKYPPNLLVAQANAINIKQEVGDRNVLKVRGNGNCLIKSIMANILHTRNDDSVKYILAPLLDETKINQLCKSSDLDHIQNIIDGDIINELCINIRNKIVSEWDYLGCPEYHMDSNAIDGLAREMVMRILCIDKLVIYSLKPGNDPYKKTITVDTRMLKRDVTPWQVNLLCAQGFCHYSALI